MSYPYPPGLPEDQEDEYDELVRECVAADDSWQDKPPVNRSDPPPNPNQQSCLQELLSEWEGFSE